MKKKFSTNTVLNSYYFLFSFFLVYLLIQKTRLGYFKESYQITEFLINYQGGFVRRGLLGEIILILYNTFGILPYHVIITLSFLSFVFLVWFFIQSFIKKKYPLFFLPFVFFLGNPIIHDFWVRKDVLLILIFIVTVYFLKRKSRFNIIFANFTLSTGILIHESLAFFSFPILFLFLFSNKNNIEDKTGTIKKSFLLPIAFLSPSLIAFILVIYFKGSLLISHDIWDSWRHIPFPLVSEENLEIPAAVQGLSWSLKEGLQYSLHTLRNFNDGIYAPVGWFIIITLIYYILTNTEKMKVKLFGYKAENVFDKKIISNLLLIQFCAVIPLFILGWDYGRWIFFWVTSTFSVYLLVPQKELSELFPKMITHVTTKTNNTLDQIFKGSNILLLSLLIGFSAHSWGLVSSINSSSLIIVLKFISKVIEHMFLLLKEFVF